MSKRSNNNMRRMIFQRLPMGIVVIAIGILPFVCATDKQEETKSPPAIDTSKTSDPLIDDPKEPVEQCQMLNQVQSVVIQILSAHYEYGKGIHRLHGVVDNLQKDIVVLKSTLDELDKRQSALEQRNVDNTTVANELDPFGANKFLTNLLDSNDALKKRHFLKSGIFSIQRTMSNLTNAVHQQEDKIVVLNKKLKRLRRTMKNAASAAVEWKKDETPPAAARRKQEEDMLEHFMIKQKEINGNLIKRMRFLEEKWERVSIQQQDSPRYQFSHNGCPTGFVRHYSSCYKFDNVTKSWIEGEKHCQGLHPKSHLVGIETREEGEYLVKYRAHNNVKWSSNYMWTGGNDMMEEGKWTWVGTGRSLLYTYWRAGEPDNHNEEQHCIYMRADGADHRWDDWNCHAAKLNIVCEINLGP